MFSSIAALFGLGGQIAYSAAAAKAQYRRQVNLQKMAQEWAENMSNTAHQREVADLRKAGMNPILTATGGNGASWSSPSPGHAEQAQTPDFSQVTKAMNDSAAVQVAEKNADTQAAAQASQASVNQSIVDLNQANTALAQAKAAKEGALTPIYNEGKNIFNKGIEAVKTLGNKDTWKGIFGSSSAKDSQGLKSNSGGHVPGYKDYPGRSVPMMEINKKTPGKFRMSFDGGKSWNVKTTKGWKR